MSDVIFLSDVRLSFPHIAEPQRTVSETTGKERVSYNADFIMAPNHSGFAQFWAKYNEMMVAKFKEHAAAVMNIIQTDRKLRGFGQGAEKVSIHTHLQYDGYADNVFITAGSDRMPQMIQADGSPVDPANTMACNQLARRFYGGCRVNAAVKPWVQQNKHGNGFRCDLVAVQFFKDDVAFGEGAPDVTGMFGTVAAPVGPSAGGQAAPAMPWMTPPATQMPAPPFGAPVAPALPSFFGGR